MKSANPESLLAWALNHVPLVFNTQDAAQDLIAAADRRSTEPIDFIIGDKPRRIFVLGRTKPDEVLVFPADGKLLNPWVNLAKVAAGTK